MLDRMEVARRPISTYKIEPTMWGTLDPNNGVEARPRWPPANKPSTMAFIQALEQHAAPAGVLVAVLAGHTHENLVCQRHRQRSSVSKEFM